MADQTHAEIMLAKIEAVLEGRITADIENYQIAGRQITKIPIAELLVLRDRYRVEVKNQKAADDLAAGLGSNKNVKIRF